jgi:hypothetical protein
MRVSERLERETEANPEPGGFTERQWAALDASLMFVVCAVAVTVVLIGVVVILLEGPWF